MNSILSNFTFEDIEEITLGILNVTKTVQIWLIAYLLFCVGVRTNELAQLAKEDFFMDTQVLRIKASQQYAERLIPLSKEFCEKMQQHLEHQEVLFVTKFKNPFSEVVINQLKRKLVNKAGYGHFYCKELFKLCWIVYFAKSNPMRLMELAKILRYKSQSELWFLARSVNAHECLAQRLS